MIDIRTIVLSLMIGFGLFVALVAIAACIRSSQVSELERRYKRENRRDR